MTRDELLACLQSIEWSDIEFKEASWAVPKDALSTVSAFANTAGGQLVFGVKQANGLFAVTGVTDADKVQNDFLGQVRDVNKVSIRLPINGLALERYTRVYYTVATGPLTAGKFDAFLSADGDTNEF